MKTLIQSWLFVLALVLAVGDRAHADRQTSNDGQTSQPTDVRAILEKARATGSLPDGLVVRISACLGAAEQTDANHPVELVETWEFSSNQVHRVERDTKDGKLIYRRLESHAFDSKHIAGTLLDEKAIEIATGKGTGPRIGLIGTGYKIGSRSIEVVWRGQTLLDLHETNGAVLDFYPESDARAFGSLYGILAGQARDLFKPTAAK